MRPGLIWVKTGKAQCEHMFSAVALIADIAQRSQHVRFVPIGDSCTAAPADLFDHIVSLGEQRGRYGETERIRGLAIYDEFEFGRSSTGRSAGLAPFRILSTKVAARRKRSTKFGP
jgi:hypothetical protein